MQIEIESSNTDFRQFIQRINLFTGSTHLESRMNNIKTFVLIGSKWPSLIPISQKMAYKSIMQISRNKKCINKNAMSN